MVSMEDFFPTRGVEMGDFYPDGIPHGRSCLLDKFMDKNIPPMMAGWALQFMESEHNAASKKVELLRMIKFLDGILETFDPELHKRINT